MGKIALEQIALEQIAFGIDIGRLEILVKQFWNTKRLDLLCKTGDLYPPNAQGCPNKNFAETLVPMYMKNAMLCYEWNKATYSREQRHKEIKVAMDKLRPMNKMRIDTEPKIYDITDQYGLCRCHLAILRPQNSNSNPKILLTIVGTQREVGWFDVYRQWIRTNLNIMWRTTKYGVVHSGFYEMTYFLMKKIMKIVNDDLELAKNDNMQVEVSISGHSMGAAVATLAAYQFGDQHWCRSCVVTNVATPSTMWIGKAKPLPHQVDIFNFIDVSDYISWPNWPYVKLGRTFVIKGEYRGLAAHDKPFLDLMNNFTFEEGKTQIIDVIDHFP